MILHCYDNENHIIHLKKPHTNRSLKILENNTNNASEYIDKSAAWQVILMADSNRYGVQAFLNNMFAALTITSSFNLVET